MRIRSKKPKLHPLKPRDMLLINGRIVKWTNTPTFKIKIVESAHFTCTLYRSSGYVCPIISLLSCTALRCPQAWAWIDCSCSPGRRPDSQVKSLARPGREDVWLTAEQPQPTIDGGKYPPSQVLQTQDRSHRVSFAASHSTRKIATEMW